MKTQTKYLTFSPASYISMGEAFAHMQEVSESHVDVIWVLITYAGQNTILEPKEP